MTCLSLSSEERAFLFSRMFAQGCFPLPCLESPRKLVLHLSSVCGGLLRHPVLSILLGLSTDPDMERAFIKIGLVLEASHGEPA